MSYERCDCGWLNTNPCNGCGYCYDCCRCPYQVPSVAERICTRLTHFTEHLESGGTLDDYAELGGEA